jgi:hypothetical protein
VARRSAIDRLVRPQPSRHGYSTPAAADRRRPGLPRRRTTTGRQVDAHLGLALETSGEPWLLLNCEEPSVREWLGSPAEFLADCEALAPGVPALFLEEVQRLPEAGLFLKGLVDRRPGKRMYAAGSSSFDLEAQTRESLVGRAVRHVLLPLSLEELTATVKRSPRVAWAQPSRPALVRAQRSNVASSHSRPASTSATG